MASDQQRKATSLETDLESMLHYIREFEYEDYEIQCDELGAAECEDHIFAVQKRVDDQMPIIRSMIDIIRELVKKHEEEVMALGWRSLEQYYKSEWKQGGGWLRAKELATAIEAMMQPDGISQET